jgi:large subunit ribosomal protein L1
MGKIRVKVLGDEEQEKKQKEEARKRAEAKRVQEHAEKASTAEADSSVASVKEEKSSTVANAMTDKVEKKKEKFAGKKAQKHSKNYLAVAAVVDKNKTYPLNEAISLLEKVKRAKFDETVELHINTTDKGISGSVTLPNGTGKEVRITIANQSEDPKAVEDLVRRIEAGQIDFDILIATPDSMPKLARVARFLGPRGLMPNPKNGTVTPKPEEVAKKYQGGQVNFKTEAKFPLLHFAVGKVSFGEDKLAENIKAAIEAIQTKNIKTLTLKSTMSPGIAVDVASL